MMRILSTHHLAITTSQFGRLRDFYERTLGLPVVGGFPGHDIVFIAAGTTTIELIGQDTPADDTAADEDATESTLAARARRRGWHHLAWEVEDVDAAFAELAAAGVPVHSPPESFPPDAPTMRIAFLRDPDGNLLELVQPLASRYPPLDRTAIA
jgi:catechol 2,3-dioxygenase-like lactoylglutathione lyase family enzyme